jgi:hypothetical protein
MLVLPRQANALAGPYMVRQVLLHYAKGKAKAAIELALSETGRFRV